MLKEITYARLYAMPDNKYENERFEATAIVHDGDVDAAFDEARQEVEAQHDRVVQSRKSPAWSLQGGIPGGPATAKQQSYIGRLQDDLTWTSEQLNTYASQQGVNLVTMSTREASDLIGGMKRLVEERSERPPPLADGYLPF